MRTYRRLCSFAAITSALSMSMTAGARAEVLQTGGFGYWVNWGGIAKDGNSMCGMSLSFNDGRTFMLKYFNGATYDDVLLEKANWNIPRGTHFVVRFQVGSNAPWTAEAVGSGDNATFTITSDAEQEFWREIRTEEPLVVDFPSGTEQAWIAQTAGSNQSVNKMADCIGRLPPPATQPFGSN